MAHDTMDILGHIVKGDVTISFLKEFDIVRFLSDFGILITLVLSILGYYWRNHSETRNNTIALVSGLKAEIMAIKTVYSKVELTKWEEWSHNNVQSLDEHYTVIYDNSSSRLSLLDKRDIKKIVEFYIHLKAHIDTLRVLSRIQKEYLYIEAGIAMGILPHQATIVLEESLASFKATHTFALSSQTVLYKKMDEITNEILPKYSKDTWYNRLCNIIP